MRHATMDAVILYALRVVNAPAASTRRRPVRQCHAPVSMPSTERFRAGRRLWEREDEDLVRICYPHIETAEIARVLRRPVVGVYQRAKQLGVRKSAAYLAAKHAEEGRRLTTSGAPHRFVKGQAAMNKGLRRPGWSPGRMKETQFKRGQPSINTMPVGSTRLIDGYVYRKVSDVRYVPYTVNWKPEHHLIWIAANGPITAGHALK